MDYKKITKKQVEDLINCHEIKNIFTADIGNQFGMYRFVRDLNKMRDGTNDFTLFVIET